MSRFAACLRCALLPLLFWHAFAGAAPAPAAWAYIGWWLPDSWRQAPLNRLDRLLFFELKVGANGSISQRNGWPEQWSALRTAARSNGVALDLTLTVLDAATFEQLFSSKQACARLLDEATALARHADVAGLQIDMEVYTPLPAATIVNFQRFIHELSQRLRGLTPARKLSVFFPMGAASPYYDKATLAQVDYVVLQGYDAHWTESARAGPVAPLAGPEAVTWEKALAAGLALGVPKPKMLFSFPFYGYEWPVMDAQARSATTGPATQISYAPLPEGLVPALRVNALEQARRYGARHELPSASAWYRYRNKDGAHVQGWFEDRGSLTRKANWVERNQVGGIAFFVLGYDRSELLRHHVRHRPARAPVTP